MMNKFFSCAGVRDELKAFHDGELHGWRHALVRRHLAQCAACREELEFMSQIETQLRETESDAPTALPDRLRERILSALPAADVKPIGDVKPIPQTKRRFYFAEYATMGAVALLIVFASFTVMGRRISNTFNSAASQMDSGGGYLAQTQDRAPSYRFGSPGAANKFEGKTQPQLQQKMQEREKTEVESARLRGDAKDRIAGAAGSAGSAYNGAAPLPDALRKVHKEGSVSVEVDDLEAQSDAVERMVKSSGGYVVSNNLSTGANGRKNASLEVRVPVKQFESVIAQIGQLGEVKAKRVTGQDITEQVSDAQQAKNVLSNELSIREAQLRALEAKRKRQPNDDWQLRAQVRRLRIEASQARARLELMQKLSDLSNISVQLQEKEHSAGANGFTSELSATTRAAADTFLLAVKVPINLLIWALAYSPLWIPLVLIVRWLFPRRTIENAQAPPNT